MSFQAPSDLITSLPDGSIQCHACQHHCVIPEGKLGKCRVRGCLNGRLNLPVYGKYTLAVDPIEKKPLYHFLPGSSVYSYGTVGCNFSCQFCQNSSLSMWRLDVEDVGQICHSDIGRLHTVTPEQIVKSTIKNGCQSIASTYNEPTISSEFSHEVFKLAQAQGIRTIYVTNGFESVETLNYLGPYLDAVNIDLKGWDESFYHKICGGTRAGVCKTIQRCFAMGIHTEVTTLVIPDANDSDDDLTSIAQFLVSVSPDIVWHVSAYHDDYKFHGRGRTPLQTLQRAAAIGKRAGIHFVYMGNVQAPEARITKCPKCGKTLVDRQWGSTMCSLHNGKCKCGCDIPGFFEGGNTMKPKINTVPLELLDPETEQISIKSKQLVVFSTKGGTSKGLAENIGQKLGFPVADITTVTVQDISQMDDVVFVVSTYGRGAPPPSGAKFWSELNSVSSDDSPMHGVKFAVLGCGSMAFNKTFCGFAKDLDGKMTQLGGTAVTSLGVHDEEAEEDETQQWIDGLTFQ